MKYNILIFSFLILIMSSNTAISDNNYIISGDTVYIDDSKVYLSATPHTLSSSGWVYFNLISKVYTGNIDACWGFNTSVSKPTKADVYSPHWVNTTTNHEKIFYNPSFITYTGDDLDYGNSYNTNYRYTINESVVSDNGTTYITSNAAFDSYTTAGTNYTIYWYTKHDNHYLWRDFSSSFNSVIHDYKGYNKWYYIKNVPIISNKEYTVRAWIDVPVNTEKQSGKYYFAIKPSGETISHAVTNGHFYNLDPWWNATWSKRKEIILIGGGGNTSVSFDNPIEDGYVSNSEKESSTMYIFSGKFISTTQRGYSEWDISLIPSDAIITKAIFKYHGYSNAEDCIIKGINIQPSISSASNIYTAAGNGDIYADITGFPEIGNNKQIILNNNATSDIQSAISTDWFAISFINKDENNYISELCSEEYVPATTKPTLYVEYTSVSEGGVADYQLLLNVTYEPEMQSDFDDLRFSNETHEIDSWLESKVNDSYALVWVEFPTTPANGANQTYYMYYGNADAVSDWDIRSTMLDGDDFIGASLDTNIWDKQYCNAAVSGGELTLDNFIGTGGRYASGILGKRLVGSSAITEIRIKNTYASDAGQFGLSNNVIMSTDDFNGILQIQTNNEFGWQYNEGTQSNTGAVAFTENVYYKYKLVHDGVDVHYYRGGVEKTNSPLSSNVPDEQMYMLISGDANYPPTIKVDWIFTRKYAANPPTYEFGSEEYYIPPPTTLFNETKLIFSEVTSGFKGVNMGNYLVYTFILIGILLIILLIQILSNCIYRG